MLKIIIFIIYIKLLILTGFFLPKPVVYYNPPPISQKIEIIEINTYEQEVNKVRIENNLPKLKANECLRQRAEERLKEMPIDFNHYRPNGNRATKEQYCGSTKHGENLAQTLNLIEPKAVIISWQRSETHNRILISEKYTKIGIAFNNNFVVMEVSN